ncbi:MAG: hypothetical protein ACQES2_00150 [Pseudomonadota bacterium]
MHRIRNTLVCFVVGAISLAPALTAAETLVLTDRDDGIYGSLTSTISDAVGGRDNLYSVYALDSVDSDWDDELPKDDITSVITVGSASMRWLAQADWQVDSLSLLTTKEQYLDHFDSGNSQHSVIYLNQPLSRIVEVGQRILGKGTHFIIFDERRSAVEKDMLLGSRITYSPLVGDSVIQSIRQLETHKNYAIVALPSHTAFTPITIKNTLISAYKAGIPIIGYSQSFTRAGALFSVHADLEALDREVSLWLDENRAPRHRSSVYYQVTTNPQIAKSLGFRLSPPWDSERVNREATP